MRLPFAIISSKLPISLVGTACAPQSSPKRMALRHGIGTAGSKLVMMAGVPFGTPGSTNVLHVATLTGDELRGYA